MATEDQFGVAQRGGGRYKMSKQVTVTMAAGATTTDSTFGPPAGSRVSAIRWKTDTTFSGSPTNINLTIGKTAGAGEYVAAVDAKTAAAPTLATLVSSTDYFNWPAQALFCTLTAVGGTNPAGSVIVEIDYSPPNP